MRSKEVDKAIKRIDYLKQDLCSCEECQLNKKAYNTILSYIEQLESNKIEIISKDFHEVLDKHIDNEKIDKQIIKDKAEVFFEQNELDTEVCNIMQNFLENILGE